MNLFDNTELGLQAAIRGAGMRQNVLATNLANANTPGYVRQDVNFGATLADAMSAGVSPDQVQFNVTTDGSAPMQADGNSVDIDTESAKLAQNGLEYESLVAIERTRLDILRSAMGVAGA
ncbi:MAG: flagellar basal body rod protein FlgB [Thermoleophilaceae bacterium]